MDSYLPEDYYDLNSTPNKAPNKVSIFSFSYMNEKQKVPTLHNWVMYRGLNLFKEELVFHFEEPDKKDKGVLKDVLD